MLFQFHILGYLLGIYDDGSNFRVDAKYYSFMLGISACEIGGLLVFGITPIWLVQHVVIID